MQTLRRTTPRALGHNGNHPHFGAELAELWSKPRQLAEHSPNSAETAPSLVDMAVQWSKLQQIWSDKTHFGRCLGCVRVSAPGILSIWGPTKGSRVACPSAREWALRNSGRKLALIARSLRSAFGACFVAKAILALPSRSGRARPQTPGYQHPSGPCSRLRAGGPPILVGRLEGQAPRHTHTPTWCHPNFGRSHADWSSASRFGRTLPDTAETRPESCSSACPTGYHLGQLGPSTPPEQVKALGMGAMGT